MTNPTLARWMARALAVSCLAAPLVPTAHAVVVVTVGTDTVTDLYLDWSFDNADSGLLASYVGTYWLADILPDGAQIERQNPNAGGRGVAGRGAAGRDRGRGAHGRLVSPREGPGVTG